MELVKFDHNGLSLELKTVPEIVFNSPKIASLPMDHQIDGLENMIAKLHQDCGQIIPGEELLNLTDELQKSIELNYNWITAEELKIAFEKGRRKEFKVLKNGKYEVLEWFGLNLNTFEQWILAFKNDLRDLEIKKRKARLEKEKEISNLEQRKAKDLANQKAIENAMTECFLSVSSGKDIPPMKFYLYDYLYKNDRLPKHTAKFKERVKRAVLKKQYKQKGNNTDLLISIKIKAKTKQLVSQGKSEEYISDYLNSTRTNHTSEDVSAKKTLTEMLSVNYGTLAVKCKEYVLHEYFKKEIANASR